MASIVPISDSEDDKSENEKKKLKKCESYLSQSDVQGTNDFVNVDFSHVLAEPATTPSFDPFWRLSAITFRGTYRWTYRLLAAPLAIPLSIVWGVVFAILSVSSIWLVVPVVRILQLALSVVKQVVEVVCQATIEPLYRSCGAVFSNVRIVHQTYSV